jgi:hypothetical protein
MNKPDYFFWFLAFALWIFIFAFCWQKGLIKPYTGNLITGIAAIKA